MRTRIGRRDSQPLFQRRVSGAGEGIRTLDIHLGKVVLYQLSYARKSFIISISLKKFKEIMGNVKMKFRKLSTIRIRFA
jgi:hypothetical protein